MAKIENLAKKIKWDIVVYFLFVAGIVAYMHLVEPPEGDSFGHAMEGILLFIVVSVIEFLVNLGHIILGVCKGKNSIARWMLLSAMLTFVLCMFLIKD